MSFWTAENLCHVGRGSWLRPPTRPLNVSGVGTDTRQDLTGRAFVALRGERHDGHDYLDDACRAGAAMLVVDRGVAAPADIPVLGVPETRQFLADLARAYREVLSDVKVVAITGSAGKTTTKKLSHHLLRISLRGTCAPRSFNNEIGVPLTLLAARSDDDYVVVEIGTNAPGEIGALASIVRPDIAVITSIGRAHLEGLGGVDGVLREKASLLDHLAPDGVALLPASAPGLRSFSPAGRTQWFGETDDADLRIAARGRDGAWSWFELEGARYELRLPGAHNARNALTAIGVARQLRIDDSTIRAALRTASPPEMRMTTLEVGGVNFFNDAYNANPDSMIASLEAFAEMSADASRRVLVLGDMLELGEQSAALHEELGRAVARLCERCPIGLLVVVGAHAPDVARGVGKSAHSMVAAEAMDDALADRLLDALSPGDAVLVKGSRRIGLERVVDRAAATQRPSASRPASPPVHVP